MERHGKGGLHWNRTRNYRGAKSSGQAKGVVIHVETAKACDGSATAIRRFFIICSTLCAPFTCSAFIDHANSQSNAYNHPRYFQNWSWPILSIYCDPKLAKENSFIIFRFRQRKGRGKVFTNTGTSRNLIKGFGLRSIRIIAPIDRERSRTSDLDVVTKHVFRIQLRLNWSLIFGHPASLYTRQLSVMSCCTSHKLSQSRLHVVFPLLRS